MQSKKGNLGNGDNHSTATTVKLGNNGEDIKLAMTGKNHKQIKLGIEYNILATKPTQAANKIIEGHIPSMKGDMTHPQQVSSIWTTTIERKVTGGCCHANCWTMGKVSFCHRIWRLARAAAT
jgi:hypothetical protein